MPAMPTFGTDECLSIFIYHLFWGSLFRVAKKYLRRAKISVENSETKKRYDTCDPSSLGNLWIGGRGMFSDVMFHSEVQYENHDSQSHRDSFHYSPCNVFRLLLGGLAYVLQKWFLWNEAQSRMDAYPSVVGTLGGGGPVGWPRMNLEMHLHLNSELASDKFLTEFALNLHLKSESTVGVWFSETV